MRRGTRNEDGLALILAMVVLSVVLAALMAVTYNVFTAKRLTDQTVAMARLDEACKAGVDLAVEQLWHQYLVANGNVAGDLVSYREFVDTLVPNNEDLNGNGTQDDQEHDCNGDGVFEMAGPADFVSVQDGFTLAAGERLVRVTVTRTDDLTGSVFTIRSTARVQTMQRTVVQSLRVSGTPFGGFEFAILAENVNCVLCHAEINSLDLVMNGDPALYGTFERVKMASLESLTIRTYENINTHVAGTLYTRGTVFNETGAELSPSQIESCTLRGYQFNTEGVLVQDDVGNLNDVPLSNAQPDEEGTPEQMANLYLNYPATEAGMTDGYLPSSLPAPFPDGDGDRIVSAEEFAAVVNSADGYITFELEPVDVVGAITAGVAYGLPEGQTYSGTSLPSASNGALDSLSQDGSYDGNVFLVGTEYDPIVISKRVAVNGDVILTGPIKGWGQLLVKGNVYIIGDVTYADAPGEFGVAADGTKNGFAVTAGGSIMVGDYLTIRGKNHPADNSSKYPPEGFVDCRAEHATYTKTVYTGYGYDTQTFDIGYFDEGVADAGWSQGTQHQFSFTTSELMLFNEKEYQRVQGDPTYKPRYYRLRPDAPIYRYVSSDEHSVKYNEAGVLTIDYPGDAAIHDLNPKDYWVTEGQLRQFWYADEMTRPSSGRPWQLDGLYYSNNCIFCITRSSERHNSNARGQMVIRGSLVAADLGMLVAGPDYSVPRSALNLYYDKRVGAFLPVEDTERVTFARLVYRYE